MAKIVPFPRVLTFTRAFQELPLFTQRAPNGDLFYAGLIDGSIEISVTPAGDWWASDIHIAANNACRAEARTKTVRLDPDEHEGLYWLVLDVFTDKYSATIKEWVREEAAQAGLRGRAA
jgi:subtilase family serine protease